MPKLRVLCADFVFLEHGTVCTKQGALMLVEQDKESKPDFTGGIRGDTRPLDEARAQPGCSHPGHTTGYTRGVRASLTESSPSLPSPFYT